MGMVYVAAARGIVSGGADNHGRGGRREVSNGTKAGLLG